MVLLTVLCFVSIFWTINSGYVHDKGNFIHFYNYFSYLNLQYIILSYELWVDGWALLFCNPFILLILIDICLNCNPNFKERIITCHNQSFIFQTMLYTDIDVTYPPIPPLPYPLASRDRPPILWSSNSLSNIPMSRVRTATPDVPPSLRISWCNCLSEKAGNSGLLWWLSTRKELFPIFLTFYQLARIR